MRQEETFALLGRATSIHTTGVYVGVQEMHCNGVQSPTKINVGEIVGENDELWNFYADAALLALAS